MVYRKIAALPEENIFDRVHEILKEKNYPAYVQFAEAVKRDDFSGFFGKRRRRSLKENFIKDFLKPFSSELGIQGEPDNFYDDLCEFLIAEIKPTFKIIELDDSFVIHGVMYRDAFHVIELKKGLLDNSKWRTQEEWVEYSRKALKNNDFIVGSMPLYHAIFATLYRNRKDTQYNAIIKKVRAQFRRELMSSTLTRIHYKPASYSDVVTHSIGMPDQSTISADLPRGEKYVRSREAIKALLLYSDLAEVDDIYKWLRGFPLRFWCDEDKSRDYFERAVVFNDAHGDWHVFSHGDPDFGGQVDLRAASIDYKLPAFGVRIVKTFFTGKKSNV